MPERICIFGSRASAKDPLPASIVAAVMAYVNSLPSDTIVVTGGADGVDRLAYEQAKRRKLETKVYEAEWGKYGLSAGPRRNAQMVSQSDRGQGFRRKGKSNGTDNCAEQFKLAGKPAPVFLEECASCSRCQGYGERTYPSTAMGRGIGGQMMTWGRCDCRAR